MSDFDTNESNEKGTEKKRTRRPSEPKPMFIVYSVNDDGETITVHALTKEATDVLVMLDDNPTYKYTKQMLA